MRPLVIVVDRRGIGRRRRCTRRVPNFVLFNVLKPSRRGFPFLFFSLPLHRRIFLTQNSAILINIKCNHAYKGRFGRTESKITVIRGRLIIADKNPRGHENKKYIPRAPIWTPRCTCAYNLFCFKSDAYGESRV